MSTWHKVIAVVGLVGVAAGGWWMSQRMGASGAPATASAAASGPAKPGAGNPGRGPGGPAAVEVAKVELAPLEDAVTAVGTLRAVRSVMLRSEVAGRIKALGFVPGQAVKAGQVMVQLDDALQQAQWQQAEAQAQIARTNLQRSRELLAQNFVSQSAVDQNAAALQVAQAQVAVARAQVDRMRVLAPFSGVAGLSNLGVGDHIKDGVDLLNVDDTSQVWADFRVPEAISHRLKIGLPVELSFDGLAGQSWTAQLQAIDSQVDTAARSVQVRAKLDNPKGLFKGGMFARVKLVLDKRSQVLLVPEEALVPLGGKQVIFKLVQEGEQAQAQRLEAKVGARIPGKVEILEGLSAGDQVITAGQARLQRGDKQPVRVVDLAKLGRGPQAGKPAAGAASGASAAAAPASGASR